MFHRPLCPMAQPVRKLAAGAGPASAAAHAGLFFKQSLKVQFIQKKVLWGLQYPDAHFSALSLPEGLPGFSRLWIVVR